MMFDFPCSQSSGNQTRQQGVAQGSEGGSLLAVLFDAFEHRLRDGGKLGNDFIRGDNARRFGNDIRAHCWIRRAIGKIGEAFDGFISRDGQIDEAGVVRLFR